MNWAKHGDGILSLASGLVAKGEWKEGKLPRGKVKLLDGSIFQGDLNEQLQPDGKGLLETVGKDADFKTFKGFFRQGKPVEGFMTMLDGSTYSGKLDDQQRPHSEEGTFTWPPEDGRVFGGRMEHGKPVHGVLTYRKKGEGEESRKYRGALDSETLPHDSESSMEWKDSRGTWVFQGEHIHG